MVISQKGAFTHMENLEFLLKYLLIYQYLFIAEYNSQQD